MRGYLLIELLTYLAILSFMLTGLFTSVILLHDSLSRSKESAEELLRSLNAAAAADIGTHEM